MERVKCDLYGQCPVADGTVREVESAAGYQCPRRAEGLDCHIAVAKRPPVVVPVWAKLGALALVAVALLGGLGWLGWQWLRPARCEAAKVDALLRLAPTPGELDDQGQDCLSAGLRNADMDALGRSVTLLRAAADKGAASAALALAQLYDPIHRPELETRARQPEMLPPPDPVLAVRYYDLAAKGGDAAAADGAAALRRQFSLPDASGAQSARGDLLPLGVPGHPDLYQRVIAKPGARLAAAPGGTDGQPLRPLDILYVFERRPGWLRVGHSLQSGAEGWIAAAAGEAWQVMLAMRYAPQGGRRPALFFRDDMSVAALLAAPDATTQIDALLAGAQARQPDPRLVAVEDRSVDWTTRPYVMPILRTRTVTTDAGTTVTLAQVASVAGLTPPPAPGAAPTAGAAATPAASPSYCTAPPGAPPRHAVMFAIDTTASMGPYIEQARQVAESWRTQVEQLGLGDRVGFGVVAFRGNMDAEPQRSQLEYTAKVALPLTSGAAALAPALAGLSAAKVSTRTFDEDGVAGLRAALDQDWAPYCGLRLIVYVTDAGALGPNDPLARHRGQGLFSIAAEARERHILVLPAHLATREAKAAGNFERARAAYQASLGAGESGRNAYRAIEGGSPQAFRAYLDLVRTVTARMPEFGRLAAPAVTAPAAIATPAAAPPAGAGGIDALLLGELFAVQQRFLGATAGAAAPTFASSWTSDRDLADPGRPALQVVAMLTRRQLNQLAEQTRRLILLARNAKLESARFFALLRMTSAASAQDPSRFGDDASRMGSLLPSFLQALPYRSDVLALDEPSWRAMGASRQDAFIQRLEQKVTYYRALNADQSRWVRVGGDEAEALGQVPLSELP